MYIRVNVQIHVHVAFEIWQYTTDAIPWYASLYWTVNAHLLGSDDNLNQTSPRAPVPAPVMTKLKPDESMQAPAQASYNGARPKQPAPARDVIEMKALRGGNAKYKKRQPYLIKSNSDAADARGDPVKVYVRSSGWTSLSDIQKVQNWTTPM